MTICTYVHVCMCACMCTCWRSMAKQAQYALIAALKATRDMPTSPLTSALALSPYTALQLLLVLISVCVLLLLAAESTKYLCQKQPKLTNDPTERNAKSAQTKR